MFNSAWKEQIQLSLKELSLQISDLKKSETELRGQNSKLLTMMKNLGRKLALRLPVSIESLEKGLPYDLIFAEEIEVWKSATQGLVLDIRTAVEFQKASVPGSINIPFEQLATKLESLMRDIPILVVCDNGIKSVTACELLAAKAFPYLYVLKGGYSLYKGAFEPQTTEVLQ